MLAATLFLVVLDVAGGLPFLMTVKPSERTEMAAVHSTFRDVSAVISPAFARLVLVFAPVAGLYGQVGLHCSPVPLSQGAFTPDWARSGFPEIARPLVWTGLENCCSVTPFVIEGGTMEIEQPDQRALPSTAIVTGC
ncbi:MAG: hypothetical protein R3D34_12920 [Nitratireductor sp.]